MLGGNARLNSILFRMLKGLDSANARIATVVVTVELCCRPLARTTEVIGHQ